MDVDPGAGLDPAGVAERVAAGLTNDVPQTPTRTYGQILRANLLTRFTLLLGSLFVLAVVVGPGQDALFGVVIATNAAVGIWQEVRAKWTLERLSLLSAPKARVVRGGRVEEISPSEVVMDDVLDLGPGDQLVVDAVVASSNALELDESSLTGESNPVPKQPGDEVRSGSFVASGSGRARTVRVGSASYAAGIAAEARRFSETPSELRDVTNRILRLVTIALVPTAVLLFISQLTRSDQGVRGALSSSVAGTVAMVPEGLVLLTTVAFAVGAVRLARRSVLVRDLPAVEGLARVDTVCMDKTGTLTEGRLVVEEIRSLDAEAPVNEALGALAAADPRPNATLRAIAAAASAPRDWHAEKSLPFSSARGWAGAAFAERGTWLLGAPERLLSGDGSALSAAREEGAKGRRVLILARSGAALDGEAIPEDLRPCALVSIGDRVRTEAAGTVSFLAAQGIRLIVLSGDSPETVGAVARDVGIATQGPPVDSRDLPEDPVALADPVSGSSVFGRVDPARKRSMISALQAGGHVVAMIGDGVNDVSSIKQADVGIAMGSGSDATRAVAQLVLMDSSFAGLPGVVSEGRRVLSNIERTSNMYLTKTVYALLLALAVGVAGFAFPFLPRHLTLIGALTIGIPSAFVALGYSGDQRFRPGMLGRVLRFTIPAGALAAVATFLGYALIRTETAVGLEEARTTAVMVLVWIGLLVLSIAAAPLSRSRLALIWSMAAAFMLVLVVPGLRTFFALHIPPLDDWLAAFGIAALVWSFARLFVPAERPSGPNAANPDG